MAQAQSRRTTSAPERSPRRAAKEESSPRRGAAKEEGGSRGAAKEKAGPQLSPEAKAAAEASAEKQLEPMTAEAHAKAQEDFDADERIVQRSSYGNATAQPTRHDGYQYFDPENPEGKPAESKGKKTAAKTEDKK